MASRTGQLRARGWQLAARIPWPLWWPLVGVGCLVMTVFPARAVHQWARNFATVTGRAPQRWDVMRGLWSWARNSVGSMQVGHLPAGQIDHVVLMPDDDRLTMQREVGGRGLVVGLPHSGSWDLAGVWACHHGMPVSTVAEELVAEEFQTFLEHRRRLGFTVYGHRNPNALRHLVDDARTGHLVCLLADRDFSVRGVPVTWHLGSGDHPATMPAGPAQVALRSGAALRGVACHFDGRRMRLVLSPGIVPDPAATTQRQRISSMTQQLCDFFAAEIRRHPHDWHMMQPFFTSDIAGGGR
ncbi:phosphatidylinositol mannoside acyltransferase [Propionibacteriaceae bacterium G1746]|uniref:phosphatidylinositol mannoside acyltransferase n=1 Tax=Aestuariimicrobium sp. G57 TaxID=3418485 RepID=UPI003C22D173